MNGQIRERSLELLIEPGAPDGIVRESPGNWKAKVELIL